MANQENVTSVGAYVELSGNAVNVSSVGAYIELNSSEIRVTSLGTYVEIKPVPDKFEFYHGGRRYYITSARVQFTISDADATTLLSTAKERIPILPDWVIDIDGHWSRTVGLNVGTLVNQIPRPLSFYITDRYGNAITLYNDESFIQNYTTDLNIDEKIVYKLTFVGSGILNTL